MNSQYGFDILENAALLAVNKHAVVQYLSLQYPSIVLLSKQIINSSFTSDSKKCAIKCLEAWISLPSLEVKDELIELLITCLKDFSLLDEVSSCISQYLECIVFKGQEVPSLYAFIQTIISFLSNESNMQFIRTTIALAEILEAIGENYTYILNKVKNLYI